MVLAVDFRVYGVDVLPDPAGWLAIAWCMWKLGPRPMAVVAVAGGVASAATVHLPYHYRTVESFVATAEGGAATQTEILEYDDLGGWPLLALLAGTVAAGVVVVALVHLLRERATASTDDPVVRVMVLAAGATLALWVAPQVVAMSVGLADDAYDPIWNDPLWRVELAGVVATLVLAGTFVSSRREPWALPPGTRRAGNWSRPVAG